MVYACYNNRHGGKGDDKMNFDRQCENVAWMLLKITALLIVFALLSCGTMYKMEIQEDGTYKEVPIMAVKSFARDMTYSKTTTEYIGTNRFIVTSETYSCKGTTANVIGASAKLAGAFADMMP